MAIRIDEVFYELRMHTNSLSQSTARAEREFDKLGKFFINHPQKAIVGGTAAMAAGILAVTIQAARMGGAIDKNMRALRSTIGGTEAQYKALGKTIERISLLSGRSQLSLSGSAVSIARGGAKDPADVARRLKIATDLADASGTELTKVIEALDLVMDAFHRSTSQASDDLAQMFALTKGKVPLDDLFAVMSRGAAIMGTLNVEAVDFARTVAALRDAEVPAKQAGTVVLTLLENVEKAREKIPEATETERRSIERLIEILGPANLASKGLTNAIAELAAESKGNVGALQAMGLSVTQATAVLRVGEAAAKDTRNTFQRIADAQREVAASARENRGSMENLDKSIREGLNAELLRLSNVTLPPVLRGMRMLADAISPATREARLLEESLIRLSDPKLRPAFAKLGGDRQLPREFDPMNKAQMALAGRDPEGYQASIDLGRLLKQFQEGGKELLKTLSPAELATVGDNLRAALPGAKDREELQKLIGEVENMKIAKLSLAYAEEQQAEARRRQAVTDAKAAADRIALIESEKRAADALTEARKNAMAEIESLAERSGEALVRSTSTAVDDAERELQQFVARAAQIRNALGDGLTSAQNDVLIARQAELEAGLQRIILLEDEARKNEIRQLFADATVTQVDNMQLSLEAMVKKLREMGVNDDIVRSFAAMETELIGVTGYLEMVQGVWDTLENGPDGFGLEDIGAVTTKIDEINVKLNETNLSEEARNELLKARQPWLNKHKEMFELMWKLAGGTAKSETTSVNNTKDIADNVERSARAALQLASAFGILDDKTAAVLQSIAQVGAGIANTVSLLNDDTSKWTDIVGAALPIAGGIASIVQGLFADRGPSPEEVRANELQERNNELIERLNRTIGDADKNVTGRQATGIVSAIRTPIFHERTLAADQQRISKGLEAAGLSMEDLIKVAEELGVELDDTSLVGWRKSMVALDEAIRNSEFTRFAETFADQLRRLDLEFEILDITDPADKLRRTAAVAAEFGSTFFEQFASLDFNSAEGRAAADQFIRHWFNQVKNGTFDVTVLGDMSFPQFLEWLQTMDGLLDELTPALGEAAEGIEELVGAAGESLGEILSRQELNFRILGKSTGDQLDGFLNTLFQLVPGIGDVVGQVQLATQEGRDAMRQSIREWWDSLSASSDLGGLEQSEIGQLILQIFGLLDSLSERLPDVDAILTTSEALRRLKESFDILNIDDPMEQFRKTLEALEKQSPGNFLANALRGIDLTTREGVERARQIVEELYRAIEAGATFFGPDGAPFDFLEWLSEFDDYVDAAADAIATAAERMLAATDELERNWDIKGIDDAGDRLKDFIDTVAEFQPAITGAIGAFDLTTESGRAAALEQIGKLYDAAIGRKSEQGADVEAIEAEIELLQRLARMLRDVPGAIAEEIVDAAQKDQQTDFVRGARGLTEYTGMRMADYLNTIGINTREIALNTRTLAQAFPTFRTPPGLQPPPMPFAAASNVSTTQNISPVSIRVASITVQIGSDYRGTKGDLAAAVQRGVSNGLRDAVDEALGRKRLGVKRRKGDTAIVLE